MTYPPQPGQPYGGQPDPYGQGGHQQQGGGYPQSGQFPQQGGYPQGGQYPQQGGYPQSGAFPQQGGQYDQYGQYQQQQYGYPQGGEYGGPPKKSKTGLWVGLSVLLVALVAFGVTGFLAPGFLLGDDEDEKTPGGGGEEGGAQAVAEQIITGLKNKDAAALNGLKCSNAGEDIDQVINSVSTVEDARLGEVNENGDTATATASITAAGQQFEVSGDLAKENGKWCWQDVAMGGVEPPPATEETGTTEEPGGTGTTEGTGTLTETEAESVASGFIDALNSGNAEQAKAALCPESAQINGPYVDIIAGDSPDLSIGSMSGELADVGAYEAILAGTVRGKDVTSEESTIGVVDAIPGGCVDWIILP
ncbi:hypothetical protein BAY61_30550 [Prauserella marina]|uniref:Uncharacterized protein n=1 Tax=Prauserella marina TaxID=530584 RepID=A0A222VXK0_9PSEU|nr:hypothetical protein [Prauserella marina]ASR38620.1 hypothetical protein BAY61_30550 [Prauserella marina]PWV81945.1 hypothetical protein DES30_102179 [Prauserella marina]SDD15891.1 hypothetical protein SAMN05421630_106179 [Prauserella marina]